VNMRGEVIGINSAVNASGGIGFAIPINMVKEMLPDLKAKGRYARSWLGIKIQPLTPELSETYGLKRTAGALVAEVVPDGPAAKAQLREGDVILTFDGHVLRQASDLPLYASMAGVGKKAPLKVWRDGKEVAMSVTLTEFPGDNPARASVSPSEASDLGIVASDLTPMLQQQLGLEDRRGVVIKELNEAGPAARAGLRPGDVLVNINGRDVPNMHALAEQMRRIKAGEMVRIKLIRGGAGLFVALKKP
ncbi:MAG: PDZ domain-containing protein, partial [Deltaproteobacteria bacterium]